LIFSSLLQVYKKYHIRLGAASDEVTGNIVEENTITARLFKKRNIDHDDELQIYLFLPTLDGKTEPLQWWKMNEMQFPGLASMARDYLAIPATSVPSEQCFSTSKNLISSNRNRLIGKTVRACMCLKSWWTGPLENNGQIEF